MEMVKLRCQIAALLVTSIVSFPLSAAIINVNEVMVNAPEPEASYEWIELYVDAATTNLSFYELRIGSTTLLLSGIATSGDYILVCRDTAAVKARWAVPAEQTRVRYFQRTFSLTNGGGRVEIGLPSNVASSLDWTNSTLEGVSWERARLTASAIQLSQDPIGATPGFINSVTLLSHDLALRSVTPFPSDGQTFLDLDIENKSTGTFSGGQIRVYEADSLNPSVLGTELLAEPIPSIDSGFSSLTRVMLPVIPSTYAYLAILLDPDDRSRNNRIDKVVPASLYPPLVLNELLPNPAPPQFSEWVELKNRSSQALSLNNWKIGDVGSLTPLPMSSLQIAAGGYVVLAQDSVSFRSSNPSSNAIVIQPSSWNPLGNSGDLIRLVDSYQYEADRFSWSGAFSDNITRARDEDALTFTWGESESEGGTPGTKNIVRLTSDEDSISLIVDPPYLKPGDDRYGSTEIRISPPSASSYSLTLYDDAGRVVVRFLDDESTFRSSYQWDGYAGGFPAKPGRYLVLLEAVGVESIRRVLVVLP